MSPFKEIHIEYPYHQGLEDALASLVVFNSQETLSAQKDLLDSEIPLSIYPNPAPTEFSKINHRKSERLRDVLVVSNHAPEEIHEAASILREQEINVDFLAERFGSDKPSVISPELLAQYDVVISIGKTVQDCLVAGIPVYVYDHFGGVGYLDEENFSSAEFYNFSGRKSDNTYSLTSEKQNSENERKSADRISGELVQGYSNALLFQQQHLHEFIDKFQINRVFAKLMQNEKFRNLKQPEVSSQLADYFINAQQMVMDYHLALTAANDSQRLFYSQKVTVFESPGDVFSNADVIKQDTNLAQAMVIPIRVTNHQNFRIDYGEMPCFVQDLEVFGVRAEQYVLSSDATISDGSSFVFPFNDPKVLLSLQGVDEGTDIEICCKVKPFSKEMPKWVRDLLEQRTVLDDRGRNDAQELCAIKESKWWKLGERLRRVIHKR
jgi:hypothetical protein